MGALVGDEGIHRLTPILKHQRVASRSEATDAIDLRRKTQEVSDADDAGLGSESALDRAGIDPEPAALRVDHVLGFYRIYSFPWAPQRNVEFTGISEEEAGKLIVNGFIEPIVKELPMEYAVEMNRLIELQMEGSIG